MNTTLISDATKCNCDELLYRSYLYYLKHNKKFIKHDYIKEQCINNISDATKQKIKYIINLIKQKNELLENNIISKIKIIDYNSNESINLKEYSKLVINIYNYVNALTYNKIDKAKKIYFDINKEYYNIDLSILKKYLPEKLYIYLNLDLRNYCKKMAAEAAIYF